MQFAHAVAEDNDCVIVSSHDAGLASTPTYDENPYPEVYAEVTRRFDSNPTSLTLAQSKISRGDVDARERSEQHDVSGINFDAISSISSSSINHIINSLLMKDETKEILSNLTHLSTLVTPPPPPPLTPPPFPPISLVLNTSSSTSSFISSSSSSDSISKIAKFPFCANTTNSSTRNWVSNDIDMRYA